MSAPASDEPSTVISLPSEEFAAYCEAEFERQLNTGDEFDEAAYREAMEMALTKLRLLEQEEGLA